MNRFLFAAMLAVVTSAAAAAAEPVIVPTSGSTEETVDHLKAAVQAHGGRVFGVIDFGETVRGAGADIGEVQLVIFGDPRIGAQVLSADPMAALGLPGKILVYETGSGAAMAYERPEEMLAEWDIPSGAPVWEMMSRTLETITSAATQ
jgi:uncharacterized protein (DUF302 family)